MDRRKRSESAAKAPVPQCPLQWGDVPLTCFFDAFSGISGDMTVGALADAGADQDAIRSAISALNIGVTVSFEKVKRAGIGATKYHVEGGEQKAHRHLSHIVKMINAAEMSERAKRNSIAVFEKLGEAEAGVHQVPIEKVHFHEVGAADSIADIVGACVALDQLDVTQIVCSPVNVGSGTVKTEHGILPVPAPATAALLVNAPVYSRGPEMELTTPTGAALMAHLAERFGVLPTMKILRTGHGAGDRDFKENANVLRVILGETVRAVESLDVAILEANIDDLNPQILGYATERLLAEGALDVTVQPLLMKKDRPGNLLTVIAKPEDREKMAQLIFQETSTLGLRIYAAERRVQSRMWSDVETPNGMVRVKVSGDGNYAPEYEDCRALAMQAGVALKNVIAEANYAYLKRTK